MWPIRLRHLSAPRGFECSTKLLIFLSLYDILHGLSWRISGHFPFSHEAIPLSSNLMDMKESVIVDTFNLQSRIDSNIIIRRKQNQE